METVEIPEQVDIIISEWMGYFLLRESMLDTVLHARDRYLRPGGAMYPSHSRMYLAPIRSHYSAQRADELKSAIDGWSYFVQDTKELYGVDMSCLTEDYCSEQRLYYSSTASWTEVHPQQYVGPPTCFKEFDLLDVTLEELKKPVSSSFIVTMYGGPIEAFAGFFDVSFKGSPENPAQNRVELSTAPDPTGATHWGQLSFFVNPPIQCEQGDKLICSILISRREDNHRLMKVQLKCKVEPLPGRGRTGEERVLDYNIE